MGRKNLFFNIVMLLLLAVSASAQVVQLENESFKKSLPQGWSVYPLSTPTAPTWASDTHVAASGKYAMHGYVPYNAGDTVELVSPWYDCTKYKHVQLRFKHICKVLGSDLCQIYYRENYVGSKWKPIPADVYYGMSKDYKNTLAFDHSTYTEWQETDTFVSAQNTWWKEEMFDLSDLASYSTVAFKFVIRKGSYFGSFIADGWYLDDFEVMVSDYPIGIRAIPEMCFQNNWSDTINYYGPYTIEAKIASRTGTPLLQPYMHYSIVQDTVVRHDTVAMKKMSADTVWEAGIPKQSPGTKVIYSIKGEDSLHYSRVITDSFYVKQRDDSVFLDGAALVSINSPISHASVGVSQNVNVTFKNTGTRKLQYLILHWSINGVLQNSLQWFARANYFNLVNTNVGLAPGGTVSCDLGVYTPVSGKSDTILVWITYPNQTQDLVVSDDTLELITVMCDSLFSGKYTIGGGKNHDFQNLNDVLFKMRGCGMKNDVSLLLADGVYEENLDFVNLDSMVTGGHHILISSLSGQADKVVIGAKSGNVINMTASQNIIFENLTFTADSAAGHVVSFNGNCSDITFRNCVLNGRKDVIGSGDAYAAVYATNNTQNGIRFVGNKIQYGTYGVLMKGSDIVFDSNTITAYRYCPVYYTTTSSSFRYNEMTEGDTISSTHYGAAFVSCRQTRVEGNHIRTKGESSTQYGLQVRECDSTVMVCNNEIILHSLKGSAYGIRAQANFGTPIINNSLLVYGSSAASQYGIYLYDDKIDFDYVIYYSKKSNYSYVVRNNVVVIDSHLKSNSFPLYIDNIASIAAFDMDYNTYYSASNAMGYNYYVQKNSGSAWGSPVSVSLKTLEEYRLAFKSDNPTLSVHDTSFLPVFSDTSYHKLGLKYTRDLLCPRYGDVTEYMDGSQRYANTMKGCNYSSTPKTNMTLVSVLGVPKNATLSDTLHPFAVIMNGGDSPLTAAEIRWETDGVNQKTVKWSGLLSHFGEKDTLSLGAISLPVGNHSLKVFVSAPMDTLSSDDTLRAKILICDNSFNGTYTVGDTGYFSSLDEAIEMLDNCGMSGNVVLQLIPGTYTTNTVISLLNGMGSSTSLHITSLTGNSKDVVLQRPNVAKSLYRSAPLIIEEGVNVRVSHITLRDTTTLFDYAHALILHGNVSQVDISHCRMEMSKTVKGGNVANTKWGFAFEVMTDGSSENNALVFVQGAASGIRIADNEMEGGVCAFSLRGSSNAHQKSLHISGNEINHIDHAVCYMEYVDLCTFRQNNVHQRKSNHSNGYAMLVNDSKIEITENRFDIQDGTNGFIFLRSSGNVINNDIKGYSGSGLHVGINSSLNIFHNSLYGKGHCISTQLPGTASQLPRWPIGKTSVCNNILHMKDGSGYTIWGGVSGIHVRMGNLSVSSNCYYDDATGGTRLDGQVSMDSKSVNKKPDYKDTSVSLQLNSGYDLTCDRLPSVMNDITGFHRNQVTMMGAYEVLKAYDAALGDILVVAGKASASAVIIQNWGEKPMDSAKVSVYVNNVLTSQVRYRPNSPLASGGTDTVWLGNLGLQETMYEIMAVVHMDKDSVPINDTARYAGYVCASPLSGNYTVSDDKSVEILKTALYTCGMSDAVVVRIKAGTYHAIAFEKPVPGSDTCSITFMADSGVVVFDGGDSLPSLKLNSASNMVFKNITFGNTSDGLIGVQMEGNCRNITI
ncbi:MAG: hypothetical protein J6S82_08245, partial [Bacteroidales bacterium]|nr:hypothetical protein [Bacteroidales bacterium]